MLAEAVSCLPGKPPPSLLKACPLALLLLDPAAGRVSPDASLIVGVSPAVATVSASAVPVTKGHKLPRELDGAAAQAALASLRLVGSIN